MRRVDISNVLTANERAAYDGSSPGTMKSFIKGRDGEEAGIWRLCFQHCYSLLFVLSVGIVPTDGSMVCYTFGSFKYFIVRLICILSGMDGKEGGR